ncbi:translation initiation factor IF-3, partial [Mycobacterium tuberculosis]
MTMVLAPHRGAKTRARARHPGEPAGGPPPKPTAGDSKAAPN